MREDGRDEWQTPDDVFDFLCTRWSFNPTVDLFCSIFDCQCPYGITAEADALTQNWSLDYKYGFMNPPYAAPTLTQAVEKAVTQAYLGFETMFLLPARVDQPWFQKYIKHFEHDFWDGRIKFKPLPWIIPSSPREGSVHGVIRL